MKKLIAAFAMAALMIGCAGTPQEKAASKLQTMQQEKAEFVQKGVIAGLGIGESQNEQYAYDKATLNASTDLAKALENKVQSFARSYAEEVGSELTKHFEEVKKNIASTTLRGATIVKTEVEAQEKTIKVYAIMTLNPKLVYEALEAELKAKEADLARIRATKAYAEAQKEIEEYEASKAE